MLTFKACNYFSPREIWVDLCVCVFLAVSAIRKITVCFVMNFVQVLPASGRLINNGRG